MPDQWEKARSLFLRASGLAPYERTAFLRGIEDQSIRREVESLILAGARATGIGFLDPPSSALDFSARRADDPEAQDRLIGRRIGEFTILRLLGMGGMGAVYEAEQESPRRTVALKLTRGAVRVAGGSETLRHEARALARLNHPGIASVYHAGKTEEGDHYFAMELVRGTSLTAFVRREQLSIHQRLELFCQVCGAVHYAHMRSIIHRDLKPSNIMVDESGRPRILDFGLARITDTDVAQTTVFTDAAGLRGTLAYMSPEQARGRADEIDLRSDVYSLGVVLYEILVDRCPLDLSNVSLPEALRIICEQSPSAPSTAIRALSSDLDAITLKALSKDPDRRYQSADAMAEDIRRHLDHQPIHARRPTAAYFARKFVTRHKSPSVLAAALFLVVSGSAVWLGFMFDKASRLGAAAEQKSVEAQLAHDAEYQARTRAEMESRKARRVQEFLQEMLSEARPSHGRELTVREAVDQASERIETFDDQPEVAAEVHFTIGLTYYRLRELASAEREYRLAMNLLENIADRDPGTYAKCVRQLGRTLREQGKYTEAAALLEEALQLNRSWLGDRHTQVAQALNSLAMLRFQQGKLAEAERLLLEAIDIDHGPPSLPERLGVELGNLAHVLRDAGRLDEARELYEESLSYYRQTDRSPQNQLMMASSQAGYARLLSVRGDYKHAEQHLRESLRVSKQYRGEQGHPELAARYGRFGNLLIEMGRFEEAEQFLRQAMEMECAFGGEQHRRCIARRIDLASWLRVTGDYVAAETMHREALDLLTGSGRTGGWLLANAHIELGQDLCGQGRADVALSLFQTAAEIVAEGLSRYKRESTTAWNALAECLLQLGENDEAEIHCRRGLEIRTRLSGIDSPAVSDSLHTLGEIMLATGDAAGALEVFENAADIRGRLMNGWHPDFAATLEALARTKIALRDASSAEPLLHDALDMSESILGHNHPQTAFIRNTLGDCLRALDRFEEAEELLTDSIEILAQAHGPLHPRKQLAERRIAALHAQQVIKGPPAVGPR